MGMFRFKAAKKHENQTKTIILDGAGRQEAETEQQIDQLIQGLREEKEKVEFRQSPPKVHEWTENIETTEADEEGNEEMARVHHIKLQEHLAGVVLSGEKSFEIRRNDRGYQKGDLIQFEVVNSTSVFIENHELNNRTYKIMYVQSGWGLQEGFVAIAIKEVVKDEAAE